MIPACVLLILFTARDVKAESFEGTVKPAKAGTTLVMIDGTIYSLVNNDASLMLTADGALHGRTVRLTARRTPDRTSLEVERIFTVKDGKPFEVYYWCANCQLKAYAPGPCLCCGGETTLVETPVKDK